MAHGGTVGTLVGSLTTIIGNYLDKPAVHIVALRVR
jgi:hypothetical protein